MRRRADNAFDRAPTHVLYLGANLFEGQPLNLDDEFRKIKAALSTEGLHAYPARASADDLNTLLSEHKPEIVHFGLHGAILDPVDRAQPNRRDLQEVRDAAVILISRTGEPSTVTGADLADTFSCYADHVRCVVLNACYSDTLAHAIVQHIDHVIGTRSAIDDSAAVEFSETFYTALVHGASYGKAFAKARNRLRLNGRDHNALELVQRPGAEGMVPDFTRVRSRDSRTCVVQLVVSFVVLGVALAVVAAGVGMLRMAVRPPLVASTGGAQASASQPDAGLAGAGGLGGRAVHPPIAGAAAKTFPPRDPLLIFRRDKRCTPELQRRAGKWWLTCECESAARTLDDVYVSAVDGDTRPTREAIKQGEEQKWHCP